MENKQDQWKQTILKLIYQYHLFNSYKENGKIYI